MSMSHEAIARQFYAAFNTGDTSLLDQILAPDWIDLTIQCNAADGCKPLVLSLRLCAATEGKLAGIEGRVYPQSGSNFFF